LETPSSAYQPPDSSSFLLEQINHQQPTSGTFLSEQISISHQPHNEQAAPFYELLLVCAFFSAEACG
jgi:hypothetical protein